MEPKEFPLIVDSFSPIREMSVPFEQPRRLHFRRLLPFDSDCLLFSIFVALITDAAAAAAILALPTFALLLIDAFLCRDEMPLSAKISETLLPISGRQRSAAANATER